MTKHIQATWLMAIGLLLITHMVNAATFSSNTLSMLASKNATILISGISGTATLANSNPSIVSAQLSYSGTSGSILVTSLALGSSTLTFQDNNGKKSILVSVKAPMTMTSSTLSLSKGTTGTVMLSNSTGEIRLSNLNSEIASASLSDKTINVEAKSAGKTSITVKDSLTTLTLTVTVISGSSSTPSNAINGRLLASNCFQCHGTYGSGGFEELQGKDIYGDLMEYANGSEDPNGIMAAHLRGYTPAQLEAIANYFVNP